jgi:hypothetical protein
MNRLYNVILESCKNWNVKNKHKLIKLILKFAIKEKLRFKGRFI